MIFSKQYQIMLGRWHAVWEYVSYLKAGYNYQRLVFRARWYYFRHVAGRRYDVVHQDLTAPGLHKLLGIRPNPRPIPESERAAFIAEVIKAGKLNPWEFFTLSKRSPEIVVMEYAPGDDYMERAKQKGSDQQ
jgi:hypothetical protein